MATTSVTTLRTNLANYPVTMAMKDGRVAAFGTPEEIIRPELLSEIYETEIKVVPVGSRLVAIY